MSLMRRLERIRVGRTALQRGGRLAALAIVFAVGATWWAGPAAAAPGVTEGAITFGQSVPLSGPGQFVGFQYRAGILAAFHERNVEGGVHGRQLKLVSRDDGYEPDRAEANARQFVADNEVFAVIGSVGTPTTKRMLPVFRTAMMPFVGPLTGAEFPRNAERNPNVINLRAGFREEVELLVNHLHDEMGARRFGIIFQEDAFGRSILKHFHDALTALDLPILAKSSYSRNTHAVHAGVFSMAKADLDAVILATMSTVVPEVINTARSLRHDYPIAIMSFISLDRLRALLDEPDARILLTEVTPSLEDDGNPLVRRFRDALTDYKGAEPAAEERVAESVALQGYILGRFVIDVLERAPDELTRDAFLETALAATPVRIDDWVIVFDEGTNVGSAYVRLVNLADYESTRETAE